MREVKLDSIPCSIFREHGVVAVRRYDESLYCMLFISPSVDKVTAVRPGPHSIFLKDASETVMSLDEPKFWAACLSVEPMETAFGDSALTDGTLCKISMIPTKEWGAK